MIQDDEIAAIAQALDEWYTQLGREFGPLSRPQRRMAQFIQAEAPMRVGALAERLGLTMAGATRMLDTLEARGYATRARGQGKDQREVYVSLTPAGEEALRMANDVFLGRIAAMAGRLSAAERGELARLLRALDRPSARTGEPGETERVGNGGQVGEEETVEAPPQPPAR